MTRFGDNLTHFARIVDCTHPKNKAARWRVIPLISQLLNSKLRMVVEDGGQAIDTPRILDIEGRFNIVMDDIDVLCVRDLLRALKNFIIFWFPGLPERNL